MWRVLVTTDVGKEEWTYWEILDTVFPYDVDVRVRGFGRRGTLLIWSKLSGDQLLSILAKRLTKTYKIICFDDCCPARIRDIMLSARRVVKGARDFSVEVEVRGDYLGISEKELKDILIGGLNCLGGKKRLLVEVVWDVVGLSLLDSVSMKVLKLRGAV